MGSYLDGAGLTQVWGKLKDKIDAAKEVKSLTKAEYDALEEKEQNVIYSVIDGEGDSATTSIWLNGEQLNANNDIVYHGNVTLYVTQNITESTVSYRLFRDRSGQDIVYLDDFDKNKLHILNLTIKKSSTSTYLNNIPIMFYIGANARTVYSPYYIREASNAYWYFRFTQRLWNNNKYVLELYHYKIPIPVASTMPGANIVPLYTGIGNINSTSVSLKNLNSFRLTSDHSFKTAAILIAEHTYPAISNDYFSNMLFITIINEQDTTKRTKLLINISSEVYTNNSHIEKNVVINQISGILDNDLIPSVVVYGYSIYLKFPRALATDESYNIYISNIGDNLYVRPSGYTISFNDSAVFFTPVNGSKIQVNDKIVFTTEKDYTDVNNLSLSDYNSLTTKDNKTFYVAEYYDPTEVPVPNVIQAKTVYEYEGLLSILSVDEDVIIEVQEEARPIQLKNIISSSNNKFTYTIDENDVITIHPNSEVEGSGYFRFMLSNSIGDCIDEILVHGDDGPI